MTRSILAVLAATVSVTVVAGTGCGSSGVGDPCTPEAEYAQSFLGFNISEVNVESKSFQCETRLCLANHFQGRVTCPYGQPANAFAAGAPANGNPPAGANYACFTPIGDPVNGLDPATGMFDDPATGSTVQPQCTNRTTQQAVYCSCRCANVDGQTNDGANYCSCPKGFSCTQLVSSIGAADEGLTGAYCIISGTEFDPDNACSAPCDPTAQNCGTIQIKTQ
jgi:hypothetical protein